jgi:hypothetical protein
MKKPENIYVSLQLNKDETSGELVLNIQFDQEAPNFFKEKSAISWSPTTEELNFVSEAFNMISRGKRQQQFGELDDGEKPENREINRETDENAILDRVLEKKKTNY